MLAFFQFSFLCWVYFQRLTASVRRDSSLLTSVGPFKLTDIVACSKLLDTLFLNSVLIHSRRKAPLSRLAFDIDIVWVVEPEELISRYSSVNETSSESVSTHHQQSVHRFHWFILKVVLYAIQFILVNMVLLRNIHQLVICISRLLHTRKGGSSI